MATTKKELPVLGIKGSSNYIRQVSVTCRCGTSVVRNLKFLTPFFNNQSNNIILSTNRSYVISLCVTNKDLYIDFRGKY